MDEWKKGKQIMVVDDESDLTVFYKISLEYYGFVVDTFNDPKEALSSFKSNNYDLVILDIKMPDMDGFELYREIKEMDPTVKDCFLTASELYHEENRDKEYSTLSNELFIRKPIENEELIEKIKRLISQ
ncbi:MAG: response regulator [Nitrososphaeraceae archaeon]